MVGEREDAARDILAVAGEALEKASAMIDNLERDRLLGPALTRCCEELADMAAQVAADIHCRSDDERRELARACLRDAKDARDGLLLTDEGDRSAGMEPPEGTLTDAATMSAAQAMAELTEDDIVTAVNSAETILQDVEEVLRSVGKEEADEIADVGLTVAKMFVWSLQSIHGRVTPQLLAGTGTRRGEVDNATIEIIENDSGDSHENLDNTAASSHAKGSSHRSGLLDRRMRVLWPPLGPSVATASKWGADAASKNPILSVALGMALWPAAIMASFVGVPLLAADWAIQKGYDSMQDGPVVEAAEQGAANLYEVGKLYYLCGRLMVRQGWRVGQRQIDRRGGLGAVANDIGAFAIDRALHPVETATMAWDGLKWGAGAFLDASMFVKSVATGEAMAGSVPVDLH
eukprot:CAMPEP_0113561022 /NCGR_PEP_ID=MMETSP0015_2-20120614/19754_1 /TAXON_ID=2838 /ORGANISM="Odontella" /LENGTH=404 /DNA_ID=CAMNT_0000462789 /DNA_START=194 /DNA_END=1408 /DNA_ORIENTATION=- /assembly_acc=CAM_ASM_000160